MIIKKGMEKGLKYVLGEIDKIKKPVDINDYDKLVSIATISSTDEDLGKVTLPSIRWVISSLISSIAITRNPNLLNSQEPDGRTWNLVK